MKIGNRIKKIRVEVGLSQLDFATAIGLKRPNYANIETGRQEPTLATLTAIVTKYSAKTPFANYTFILEGKEPTAMKVVATTHTLPGYKVSEEDTLKVAEPEAETPYTVAERVQLLEKRFDKIEKILLNNSKLTNFDS